MRAFTVVLAAVFTVAAAYSTRELPTITNRNPILSRHVNAAVDTSVHETHEVHLPLLAKTIACSLTGKHCMIGDIVVGALDSETGNVTAKGMFAAVPDITSENGGRMLTPASVSQFWWPNGVVPYTIDSSFSGNTLVVSMIEEAIRRYGVNTPIRLVPRTTEANYVNFIVDGGCWSYLGMIGGRQDIGLAGDGGCETAAIQHEIGHALGLYHAQCRSDRDSYINLHPENIEPDYLGQYAKWSDGCTNCAQDMLSYDYGSMMHYGRDYFQTADATGSTFDPIAEPFAAYQATYGPTNIGQRVGMSVIDGQIFSLMYDSCVNAPAVSGGTVGWVTNPWGQCVMGPTGGVQNRTVFCRNAGTGLCLADSSCSGAKPATQQLCTVSDTGCDFDGGDYCGIANPHNTGVDNDYWLLMKGPSFYAQYSDGPTGDHTSGSGYYALFGDIGVEGSRTAALDFPPITTGTGCAVTMYTWASSATDSTLSWELRQFGSGTQLAAGPVTMTTLKTWVPTTVSIPASSGDVFVRLIGASSAGGAGRLGLDDIVFSGCGLASVLGGAAPSESNTPTTSAAVTPSSTPVASIAPTPAPSSAPVPSESSVPTPAPSESSAPISAPSSAPASSSAPPTLSTWPPAALTSASATLSGLVYSVLASSEFTAGNQFAYSAFDKVSNCGAGGSCSWSTAEVGYSTTTGAYAGPFQTTVSGAIVSGEWLQINLPSAVVVDTYQLAVPLSSYALTSFVVAGSNDNGVTWTTVDSRSGVTSGWASGTLLSFTASAPASYQSYRLIVTTTKDYPEVSEWVLLSAGVPHDGGSVDPPMVNPPHDGGSVNPPMVNPPHDGGSVNPPMVNPPHDGGSVNPPMVNPPNDGGSVNPPMVNPPHDGGSVNPPMVNPPHDGGSVNPRLVNPPSVNPRMVNPPLKVRRLRGA